LSVIKYLNEMLLSEGLPLTLAKQYTKKGKENALTLPKEISDKYDEIFKGKQRIPIGTVKVGSTFDQNIDKFNEWFTNMNEALASGPKPGAMFNPSDIRISLNPDKDGDLTFVDVKINEESDDYDLIKKKLNNAYDPSKDKYKLKTLIKAVKKTLSPDAAKTLDDNSKLFLTLLDRTTTAPIEAPVILSRHPYDVAGMSTKQQWKSCKNAVNGCNREYLNNEVGHLLIAYVVNSSANKGDILKNAYARTLVIPVEEQDDYEKGLYVSTDIYGKDIPELVDVVSSYLSKYVTVFTSDDDIRMIDDYYKDRSFPVSLYDADEFSDILGKSMVRLGFDEKLKEVYSEEIWDMYDENNPEKGTVFVNRLFSGNAIDHIVSMFDAAEDIGFDLEQFLLESGFTMEDFLEEFAPVDPKQEKTPPMELLQEFVYNDDAGIYDINKLVDAGIITDVPEYIGTKISNNGIDILTADMQLPSLVDYVTSEPTNEDGDDLNDNWSAYDIFGDISTGEMRDIIDSYDDIDIPRDDKLKKFLRIIGYSNDDIYDIID